MQQLSIPKGEGTGQIDPIRVIEQEILGFSVEISASMQGMLKRESLTPEGFDEVCRMDLKARDMSGKVHAMAELFAADDAVSALQNHTYNIDQFFTSLAKQMNQALSIHGKGSIRLKLKDSVRSTISFDARRVCTILYHLVSNAIKHGRTPNKNVDISCITNRFEAKISVRDYGGGLVQSGKEDLFAFTPAPFSFEHQMVGAHPARITGLGLPYCKKLAKDMDGDLILKNYSTGVKATLIIPQNSGAMQEPVPFCPDDGLMMQYMANLWI